MKFNGKDFNILQHCQKDAIGYIDDDRVLELMEQGFIHHNPRENWTKNGYKTTDKGKELFDKWVKEIRAKHGHIWIKNKDSEWFNDNDNDKKSEYGERLDSFAYTSGRYHNGYKCKKCGFEFCIHCYNEWEIEECSEKSKGKEMSDDSKLDSTFLAMDKSIRNSMRLK